MRASHDKTLSQEKKKQVRVKEGPLTYKLGILQPLNSMMVVTFKRSLATIFA